MIRIESDIYFVPQLYRVLHDAELPRGLWREAPEVFSGNREITPFGADWQRLSFELNPLIDPLKWRSVYAHDRAFMNGTGFDNDASPRADYINMRDLDRPVPQWKSLLFCGGALLAGTESEGELVIDKLDGFAPAPPLRWVLARPWYYFDALSVSRLDGHLIRFDQGEGERVRVPLVGSGFARYPLAALEKLPRTGTLPDPYRLYHPL